jgi:glutathione S-transferase
MVLKLYGFPISPATRLASLILREYNVPYEFHVIDLTKGEHLTDSYAETNPFKEIPYIDDDGFKLYESRAIARYVAKKYASQGPALVPSDVKKYALYEQAASAEAFSYQPYAGLLVLEKYFKTMGGAPVNSAVVDPAEVKFNAKADVYETILSKQKYLAGDEVTLADLFHLPYTEILTRVDTDITKGRPNVARWWNDISSRPAWKAAIAGNITGTA